jgi:hypothetical protein
MKDLQERNPEAASRGDEVLAKLQREGRLRADVDLETIIAYVNVVANGLALGVSLGLDFDIDAFLDMMHRGIDPQ